VKATDRNPHEEHAMSNHTIVIPTADLAAATAFLRATAPERFERR
jgi:hypothetical protein